MSNPVFLFAFTYDPANALPGVISELKAIQKIISDAGVEPVVIWQASKSDIEEHFLKHRDNIRLFHYSGHAGRNMLELNGIATGPQIVFSQGLAGFAGITKRLRLVFLNGCSTEDQAQYFLQHGTPAVIATTAPLLDRLGLQFAVSFYKFFCTTKTGSGLQLKQAFETAWHSFVGEHGGLRADMLYETQRSTAFLEEEAENAVYRLISNPAHPTAETETFRDWLDNDPDDEAQERKQKKEEIRRLIGAGRLEKALDMLVEMVPDQGLQLKSQYTLANEQYLMNLIPVREWMQEQARISFGMLQLLQRIP